MIIKNISKGKNLKTGPQIYAMTNNILNREAHWVFEHKAQDKGKKWLLIAS